MAEKIVSKDNRKIKNLRALLSDKKARKQENKFVVEGETLVKETPSFMVSEVFVREGETELIKLAEEKCSEVFVVSETVFNAISDTVSPSGILATVSIKEEICSLGNRIILLDGVRDPGNVGTLIRSAAGFGFSAAILANSADPYEPKAVRASMGGIFKLNAVSRKTSSEAMELLAGYPVFALDMDGEDLDKVEVPEKFAIAVGSESHGVSSEVLAKAAKVLAIDARGIESLNAGVAGSIAMYAFSKNNRR